MAVGEPGQLRLPRQSAAAEAVQQHQWRPVTRLAPRAGERPFTSVAVRIVDSLPCSTTLVNGVDMCARDLQDRRMTVDREELVNRVRAMGPVLAERAVRYDREASFPFENFADFRSARAPGACACRSATAGSAPSYADYVRVSEEIGRYCGATALTFNMHNATMLWCGEVADALTMSDDERALARAHPHRDVPRRRRATAGSTASRSRRASPPGATAGVATRAVPVDGGWRVTGRKIFASLSGAANFYNVICQVPGEDTIRFLGVPADADGVSSSTTGTRWACAARSRGRC